MSNRRVNRIGSRALALTLVLAFVFSQLSIANAVCLCDTPGAMACCATLPAPQAKGASDGCCAGGETGTAFGAANDSFAPVLATAGSACRLGIESSDLAPVAQNQTKTGTKLQAAVRSPMIDLNLNARNANGYGPLTERGPPGLTSRPIYERISSYLI